MQYIDYGFNSTLVLFILLCFVFYFIDEESRFVILEELRIKLIRVFAFIKFKIFILQNKIKRK